MNAQGSSRTVLFDVGGVLVDAHPDPHAIAELFGDGSRGLTTLVDQAMWTHRGEYDAGMSDREFWDRIAGDCGQPEPSSALLKELVALDASRMATANEEALDLVRRLRRQAVRLGILSNAPYPIAKAIRRSEWGSLSISSPSRATTVSASRPAVSTVTFSCASTYPTRMSSSSMTVARTSARPSSWVCRVSSGRASRTPKRA